jgi:DNA topoisomerase I
MSIPGVRRRWYLDLHGIRRTGGRERGFKYKLPDGRDAGEEKTLARIRRLRIPPAWSDVRIARSEAAPLQCIGIDRKGRTQYLYHSQFRAQREEEKFRRIVGFGESLPELRRRVRNDLRGRALTSSRVLAAIVRLMDQGFFRIGNDKSARSESTYGLTTIHGRHVKVDGTRLVFDYVGKWKKSQKRAVEDAEVAAIVRRLKGLHQQALFTFNDEGDVRSVRDRHVNGYIQAIIGQSYTAKDFRTWAGTLLCSIALGMQGQAASKAERKRKIRRAVEATAAQLGNTPAVCRSSYICPRLLDEYMLGKPFELQRKSPKDRPVVRMGLSMEERALLKFLRETIADRRQRLRAA